MSHPYRDLPSYQFWRSAVSSVAPGELDPVVDPSFSLSRSDAVGTLGSCFAQHLARSIQASGYRYFIAEPAPDGAPADEAASYGVFSARYGNVYTVRQAVQLLERAFDGREFDDDVWRRGDRWYDAFRPTVQPGGFDSEDAVRADRARHLAAVRRVFTESDVLVFTLGLTEAWVGSGSGAVYPTAPGVAAGEFDADQYSFVNFDYQAVRADLETWRDRVRSINPNVRVLLTVSPVPLAATFERRHVWVSTTYSKAVLVAVAHDVARSSSAVDYFPSYEVITSPLAGGRYYDDDLREVLPLGVQHVMRLFARHYLEEGTGRTEAARASVAVNEDQAREQGAVICDEELLLTLQTDAPAAVVADAPPSLLARARARWRRRS